uniref:Organic solute transporter subunit beta n=1 Tax=Bubo bubo TaxID=30461 RepID=A0A8C0EM98_BUBBB
YDHTAGNATLVLGINQEELEELLWFFRREDPSVWNYSILVLSFVAMILGLFLLSINIVRNRRAKRNSRCFIVKPCLAPCSPRVSLRMSHFPSPGPGSSAVKHLQQLFRAVGREARCNVKCEVLSHKYRGSGEGLPSLFPAAFPQYSPGLYCCTTTLQLRSNLVFSTARKVTSGSEFSS